MYEDGVPTGSLRQGDIIKGVPVPFLQDANEKIVLMGKGKVDPDSWSSLANTPPTAQTCDDAQDKAIFIPTRTLHLLVLSQCCEMERIEEGEEGRIIVAPLIDESEDSQLKDLVEEKRPSVADGLGKQLVAALTSPNQNTEGALKKAQETLTREKDEYLKKVWLGEVEGVFPVAASSANGFALPRSICYFAYMLSLPKSWYPILKERRVLRAKGHWRSVLQESLSKYFGRFAYPGTNADRMRVGGLGG